MWSRGFPRLDCVFKVGRLGDPGPHKVSGFSGSGYLHFWELAVLWKERNEKQTLLGPSITPPFQSSSAESQSRARHLSLPRATGSGRIQGQVRT